MISEISAKKLILDDDKIHGKLVRIIMKEGIDIIR